MQERYLELESAETVRVVGSERRPFGLYSGLRFFLTLDRRGGKTEARRQRRPSRNAPNIPEWSRLLLGAVRLRTIKAITSDFLLDMLICMIPLTLCAEINQILFFISRKEGRAEFYYQY